MSIMKRALDDAIQQYEITLSSYHDMIARKENIQPFVNVLNSLGIRINQLSWWCFVDENHKEKPHGGGGHPNQYGEGWFSEMDHWNDLRFDRLHSVDNNNKHYLNYYFTVFPKEKRYLPCIVPGIGIEVPNNWRYEIKRGLFFIRG